MSVPSMLACPLEGRTRPAAMFSRVDLPHPLGPMRHTNSFSPTSRSTSRTARTPAPLPRSMNAFVTSVKRSIQSPFSRPSLSRTRRSMALNRHFSMNRPMMQITMMETKAASKSRDHRAWIST